MLKMLKALLTDRAGRTLKQSPHKVYLDGPKPPVQPPLTKTARTLLKEATRLKKENKLIEACAKLRQAYDAPESEYLMIDDRLRLPMYLQLAGKADDGWRVLNQLNVSYVDPFSQIKIANQFRVFLEKERRFRNALTWAAWSICKEVACLRFNLVMADKSVRDSLEADKIIEELNRDMRMAGLTSPSLLDMKTTDSAYDGGASIHRKQLKETMMPHTIANRLQKLLRKLKAEDHAPALTAELATYLEAHEKYELRDVELILARVLNPPPAS